jgi:hypothetical protein
MTGQPIPERPEEATDEWLTSVLRGGGALERASVTAHTTELVEDQGAASVIVRMELQYDRSETGAPRSLVGKFAPTHEPIRALMHGLGGYAREVEFYRHFGADPGIPTPRCYHADIDPASGVFVLLFEDMSDCRRADGASPSLEDAELVVRHLAPFHAKWWNHPRLRELEFLRYPGSPADEAYIAMGRGAFAVALPAVRERFGGEFPATLATAAELLLANFDAVIDMRQRELQDSVTLLHGDCHPGNIFFPSERGGRFAVFDWQTVSAGTGGDDLARFMVSGLTAEQREASGERLIELYHTLLVEHGVTGYDIERCRQGFGMGLVMSTVMNIVAVANIEPAQMEEIETSAGVTGTEMFFDRLAAAIEAHNVLDAIPR